MLSFSKKGSRSTVHLEQLQEDATAHPPSISAPPVTVRPAVELERSVVRVHAVISEPDRRNFWSNTPPSEVSGSGVVVELCLPGAAPQLPFASSQASTSTLPSSDATFPGTPANTRSKAAAESATKNPNSRENCCKLILTCAHVVSDAQLIWLARDQDVVSVPLRVLSISHDADLALLCRVDRGEVDETELPAMVAPSFVAPLLQGQVTLSVSLQDQVWDTLRPLPLQKHLPRRSQRVKVVGFPVGGATLAVTSGVVSRVEMSTASHSGREALSIQVDAAINFGNSGGALIHIGDKDKQGSSGGDKDADSDSGNNTLLGIVHQGFSQLQSHGEALAVPVLEHFIDNTRRLLKDPAAVALRDARAGAVRGGYEIICESEANEAVAECHVPFFSMAQAQALKEDAVLREYLQLPASTKEGGVWLRRVPVQLPWGRATPPTAPTSDPDSDRALIDTHLCDDDVLLAIDDVAVRGDGTCVVEEVESPVSLSYLVHKKNIGDSLRCLVWRPQWRSFVRVNATLTGANRVMQVPPYQYGVPSDYVVFGGLVFTALTIPFVESVMSDASSAIKLHVSAVAYLDDDDLLQERLRNIKKEEAVPPGFELWQHQIIMVSDVLRDVSNRSLHFCTGDVLEKVQGVRIFNLKHLAQMLRDEAKVQVQGRHVVRFDFANHTSVVVDHDAALARLPGLLKKYRVPTAMSFALMTKDEQARQNPPASVSLEESATSPSTSLSSFQ
ncbi:MAG: hypothetical protein MHM6MM_000571 [Cercozoa sp. M6MM]